MPYDYFFSIGLFLTVFISFLLRIKISIKEVPFIIVVILASSITKYNSLSFPYYGSEYEDAYVFQAASKNIFDHSYKADAFRVQVSDYSISNGSDELLSYTGHFTVFSGVLYVFNRLIGYSSYNVLIFNFITSILLAITLFIIIRKYAPNSYWAMTPVLIYLSSPIISVFHVTGLSETFSAFTILIYLYFLLDVLDNKVPMTKDFIFVLLALFLCLLTKRENMVLFISLPFFFRRIIAQKAYSTMALFVLIIGLYFSWIKPFSTEFIEAKEIEHSTFSFAYLRAQIPTYLFSFVTFKYYGYLFITFILSVISLIVKKRNISYESIGIALLFFVFLGIYGLHYRSRFFVESMEIGAFETFRYTNNFFALLALFIGLNLKDIALIFNGFLIKRIAFLGIITIFFFAVYQSNLLRLSFSKEEQIVRIHPIKKANRFIEGENAILVTNLPLIAKMNTTNNFLIHEFNTSNNYNSLNEFNALYFLLPNDLIEAFFQGKSKIKIMWEGKDAHYKLFKLL